MGEGPSGEIELPYPLVSPPSAVLTAWIPLQAPSMNTLLQVIWSQHRLETKPAIRLFRSQLKSYLPKWTLASTGPFRIELDFHQDWYYQTGYPKKQDAPNLLKACLDAVSERYGIDDALLAWEGSWRKVQDIERVGIAIRIQPI